MVWLVKTAFIVTTVLITKVRQYKKCGPALLDAIAVDLSLVRLFCCARWLKIELDFSTLKLIHGAAERPDGRQTCALSTERTCGKVQNGDKVRLRHAPSLAK